jgi:hypothetical protein
MTRMFFRREKAHQFNFEERIANLKQYRFESRRESADRVRVIRDGCVAILENLGNGDVNIGKTGLQVGDEIAVMLHAGFQMFFRTPTGIEIPAQAHHLKTVHAFDEDLREALGLTSLYNKGLGSTATDHHYDRIVDRDLAPKHHPWDKKSA